MKKPSIKLLRSIMLLRLILKKGVDNRLVQISKLKMVIKLDFWVHPCLDYTLMDYTLMDYL